MSTTPANPTMKRWIDRGQERSTYCQTDPYSPGIAGIHEASRKKEPQQKLHISNGAVTMALRSTDMKKILEKERTRCEDNNPDYRLDMILRVVSALRTAGMLKIDGDEDDG